MRSGRRAIRVSRMVPAVHLMTSLAWTSAAWCGLAVVVLAVKGRAGLRQALSPYRERIPLILALLGTHTLVVSSDADEILANPVVAERAIRGLLLGVALVIVLPRLIARRDGLIHRSLPAFTALLLYAAVSGASTMYSAAPLVTAAKSFELVTGVAIVGATIASGSKEEVRRAIRFVVMLEAALVGAAIVGFFVYPIDFQAFTERPGFVTAGALVAPYAHSNMLSASAALVSVFALATIMQSRGSRQRLWWSMLGLGLVGVVLASGRQGLIIVAVGLGVIFLRFRPWLLLAVVVPAILTLIATNLDAAVRIFTRDQVSTLSTLTGRALFWGSAVDVWSQHPWTGYGFGAGGRFVALSAIAAEDYSNLHNGYLEALVGVGLLGVIPLGYGVYRVSRWAVRQYMSVSHDFAYSLLLVPLVMHTFIDLGFGGWLNADFILLALLIGASDLSSSADATGPQPSPPQSQLAKARSYTA